ncbi:MAG TPA: hypothetical protein VIF57_28900 [Polyangia bacterium]|jgi:hypothetical protein
MDRLHTGRVVRVHVISLAAALAVVAACGASGNLTGGGGQGGATAHGGRSGATGSAGAGGGTAGAGGMECLASEVPATPLQPDILIVVEASGSMNEDMTGTVCDSGCGASSKWAQVTSAIDSVLAQTETSVSWGLQWFGDAGADGCTLVDGPAARVAPDNASVIALALGGRTSANGGVASTGSAPTRLAISGVAQYLTTLVDANPKVIVLATDGLPGCKAGSGDPAADDSAATIDAIVDATTRGFLTYVVGIATANGPADAVLDQMAQAGAAPRAGSPAYYPVSSRDDMVATLNQVAADVSRCTFSFADPPCPGIGESRDDIGVFMNGTQIPLDTVNGWSYTDGSHTQFQLHGAACDTVKSQPTAPVTVGYHFLIL